MEQLKDSSLLLIHRQLDGTEVEREGKSDDSHAPKAARKEHVQVLLTSLSYLQTPQLDFSALDPLVCSLFGKILFESISERSLSSSKSESLG